MSLVKWKFQPINFLTGKIGSSQYKTAFVVYFNDAKIGTTLQVVRKGDNTKLIEMDMLFIRNGETYKMKFMVSYPTYGIYINIYTIYYLQLVILSTLDICKCF